MFRIRHLEKTFGDCGLELGGRLDNYRDADAKLHTIDYVDPELDGDTNVDPEQYADVYLDPKQHADADLHAVADSICSSHRQWCL